MGFCCARHPLTEIWISTSATVPGQHFAVGARSCLKINMPIPVMRTCSSLRALGTKRNNRKKTQTSRKPETNLVIAAAFFRLLENGWLWFCRVRMSGLCHYNAGSRPSGWQGKSLTGVRFKLTPRQRSSPKGSESVGQDSPPGIMEQLSNVYTLTEEKDEPPPPSPSLELRFNECW